MFWLMRFFLTMTPVIQPVFAHAQAISPRRQVRIQPLQLIFREAVVGYEWPLGQRVSFVGSVGYRYNKPSAPPAVPVGNNISYELVTMFNPHLQAVKLSVGPLLYLNRQRSFYLQTESYFRHWWVDNTRMSVTSFENSSGDFDVIRTERTNVYGVKVLLGATGWLARLGTRPVTYSAYAGFGFRYKTFWYESRDGTMNGKPVSYVSEQGEGLIWLPSVQAGILLNLGFSR